MAARLRWGGLLGRYVVLVGSLVGGMLLASGVIEIYFSYRDNRVALVRIQREKATSSASKIEQFVEGLERQIAWTTQSPWSAQAMTIDERRLGYQTFLRLVSAVTNVSYLDVSGKERLKVSRLALDVAGSDTDFSRDPKFLEAKTGTTYFGPVYFVRDSVPYMIIAMAGSGPDAGVTVAEVNLKFIWDVISQTRIGETGHAYVVDSQGNLIAHPDLSLVLKKTNLASRAQVKGALQRPASSTEENEETAGTIAADLEGRQVLTVSAGIAPLGWFVFLEQPLGEAFAPLYALMFRSVLLVAIGLVLSIVASLALATTMVTPIRDLKAGALQIGAGTLDYRIQIETGDELEELAHEFNRMASQLRESYTSLEQKVEQRTRELARSVEELTALADVTQAVSSTLDVQTVLTTIVARAVALSGGDAGVIYEHDDASLALKLRATDRIPDDLIATLQDTSIGSSIEGDGRARMLMAAGYQSNIAVPLLFEQQKMGLLLILRRATGSFSPQATKLLQTFANHSVLAIHNARLFREIEEKGRQLEIASKHKSQFLANMSHELRTPLNAILGYTELIIDGVYGDAPDRIRDVLVRVEKSGRHLLGLINDVLDLSKIEAGRLMLAPDDYSMKGVVQAVCTATESLAAEKNLVLKVTVPSDLPLGRGDERRLTQVLLNLVGNAIKFTDVGEIGIDVVAANGAFTVSVSDTGPGVAKADQGRIFEEFHQVDASSTKEKGGTGLGLAISKRIIEMHGGQIWIESSPGRGASFRFTLPIQVEWSGETHDEANPGR